MSSIIGIPWCREEDYDAFRSLFEDFYDLAATWAQFAKTAEDAEPDYQQRGAIVERVYIDPDTFPKWCASQGRRVNASARHRFAWLVAQQRHPDGSNA